MSVRTFLHGNRRKLVELFLYGVFGLLAFLVNVGAFCLLSSVLQVHYLISNALAWTCATVFAFFTNKLIVFRSAGNTARESVMFLVARLVTLLADMFLMWLLVGCMGIQGLAAKVVVNVVVIVTNYLMSKFWVFREKEK